MALYRAQVILGMDSGLLADASTNTWYFDADDDTVLDTIHAELDDFYAANAGIFSALIDPALCRVQYYRMSDPEPRTPVKDDVLPNFATGTTAGPTEVALVLSFQGAKISGLPQSRRRGRVYLGPLAGAVLGDRPTPAAINQLVTAADGLLTASNTATDWTWAQYSPTNGVGINVTDGWVDNEWDTQRRRGRIATTRTTFD